MEYDIEKISHKIKHKKMTKKVFKYIILTILIILFIINLILSFEEDTHIFGIYMFNIVSGSMEPNLEVNDVVVVQRCEPQSLQKGDIITKIEGKEVKSVNELNQIKYTYSIGDTVTLTIYRNGETLEIDLVLAELPAETEETEAQVQTTPQTSMDGSIFDFFR